MPANANAAACANSWIARIEAEHAQPIRRKNVVDDGFFSPMAKNAEFVGTFEFPKLHGLKKGVGFEGMIPFRKLDQSKANRECVCFYQNDPLFADVLVACDAFIDELAKFPCVLPPDCSLYRDMPLALQIANTYLSRLVGHYLEERGLNVLPAVRWSDERSYATGLFDTPFAFAGIPKNAEIAIGSYGCVKENENRYHFKAGLEAMLINLSPTKVYVYGSLTSKVFRDYESCTEFKHIPDWRTAKRGSNG